MRIVRVVGLALAVAAGLGLAAGIAYVTWVLRLWLRADAARDGSVSAVDSRRPAA